MSRIFVCGTLLSDTVSRAFAICQEVALPKKLTHKNSVKGIEEVFEKPIKGHSNAISMVIDALVCHECGVIKSMEEIGAVGHRVLHGSEIFADSCVID